MTEEGNMPIVRRTCLAALPLAALIAAAPASADVPQVLTAEPVEGLAVAAPYFYWASGCEDVETPSRSVIRGMQLAPPGAPPILYLPRTLFETACEYRIDSNIAVDDRYIYWITAHAFLMRMRRDGSARAENIAAVPPPNAAGYSIVVSNNWLIWSNGSGVYRKWAGPGLPGFFQVHPVVPPGPHFVRSVIATPGGYVLHWHDAVRRLVPITGAENRYLTVHLADGITAFAVSGTDVLVAINARPGYRIVRVSEDGRYRSEIYRTNHAGRVDQIAADGGAVYWHVVRERGIGPLVRMRHGGTTAEIIAADLPMSGRSRLTSSFFHLYWTNGDGLVRLPTAAASLGTL